MMKFLESFRSRLFKVDSISSAAKAIANNKPQKVVFTWVWILFIFSMIVFLLTLFVGSWTSAGPTFFPFYEVNLTATYILPITLKIPLTNWELWLPVVSCLFLAVCLRFIQPTNASRLVVKLILLFLAIRYFTWRTVNTLNFSQPISTIFSIAFYLIEVISFISCCIYILQTIWSTSVQRSKQADEYSKAVVSGKYLPSVDVLIPTYNEPDYIVRRTVIGCQAMDYPNKTIYILDDTRRSHIKDLAEELGCEYITRPDNTHAKAGNLNNALKYIKGELIVPIDADFVPFNNFLTRTVGFFQNQNTSLVQTPQYFYNPDYHARNLGLEHFLPNDLDHFYGLLQSNRDFANSVVCCGSSYVIRRISLDAVGGYYTRCCVEDFQTSLLMLTRGFRLIFLNEVLSMGESTRTYIDFLDQRLRWLQGNFQVYFCGDDIPLWSKLNWIQKTYLVSQFIYCFQAVLRVSFLLVPLLSAYLGISPVITTPNEVLYYFVPFLLLHIAVYGWATNYRVSYFWNEIYEISFCFPALKRLSLIVRKPFAKASRVTRKGVKENGKNYNFNHTLPLIIILILSALIVGLRLIGVHFGAWSDQDSQSNILIFWILYNALFIWVAILTAIDQPIRRTMDRFPLRTICKITAGEDKIFWGYTQDMSESGAKILLITPDIALIKPIVEVTFIEHNFSVQAKILRSFALEDEVGISLEFVQLSIEQQRELAHVLYTNMTWWKQRKNSGGLDSFLAMINSTIQARSILNRYD